MLTAAPNFTTRALAEAYRGRRPAVHADIETLRKLISYDPNTGKLFWNFRPVEFFQGYRSRSAEHAQALWNSRWAGSEAFTALDTGGYKSGTVLWRTMTAHKLAWAIYYGEWPRSFLDHIDGDRTNNKISNLREVTREQNSQNIATRKGTASGIKGVSFRRRSGSWVARISALGVRHYLGDFETPELAAEAYANASRKLHGEYARQS